MSSLLNVESPDDIISTNDFEWFIVSVTGSRYREFTKRGFDNFVILALKLHVLKDQYLVDSIKFPMHRKPTSEWIMHSIVHNWLCKNRSDDTVVLHTHLNDWIVISNLLEYQKDTAKLEKSIRTFLPELETFIPNGIGLLPHATPGSIELANITLEAVKKYSAIVWERHGVIITAKNISSAFDNLEILAKAAEVYLKIMH